MMCLKGNVSWRNNISFKKDTEKVVLIQVKGFIQSFVKFKQRRFCTRFYHTPHILLRGAKYRARK